MANIITRAGKGAPLSWDEADANFINLNTDKVETSILANYSTTVETNASIAAALAVHTNDAIDAHISSAIGYLPAGTGAVATDVQSKLRESVSVKDFGAKGNGSDDDSSAINNACAAVALLGGGEVLFGAGTFIVGSTIQIPDNVHLSGAGQKATTIKLKASANVNIIEKKSGSTGVGAGLFDLTIDGNDTNNTNGGVYWAGASTGRGPVFTIERVTITNCRPIASAPSGEYAALLTTGSTWGVARDVDIVNNQYAVGWWHKGSDWKIDNVYLASNGASYGGTGTHSMIVQGGAGNSFTSCYFGGNGGYTQVMVWGASRNYFTNCINDNAWQSAYLFTDLTGSGANDNRVLGGSISGAGGETNNTYPAVSVVNSTGNIFADIAWSGAGHTSSGNAAKYGLQETGTSSANYIVGGKIDSAFLTNFISLGGSSTTLVTSVFGWDSSDIQIATVKKHINVTGPYDSSAPSTSSVPLGRFNGGGAVSLWAGTYGYSYAWLQGIQDDGTNNIKPLRLNPLGGGVVIGGALEPYNDNLSILGTSGARWSVVYAGTGTINTSDEREKQDIELLNDAEKRVAMVLKDMIRKFRFKDAVAEKGDAARIHVGVIAQDVVAAFQAEGLDPMRYGIVCYDEWPDEYELVYDDAGQLTGEQTLIRSAGNRYGVRYEEMLAFIIAAL